MEEIIVPIDIMGEEKSVLAIFSLRQFGWVAPFTLLLMISMIWGDLPFMSGFVDFIVRTSICVILLLIAIGMAFLYLPKHDCYLDRFVLNWIKFRKSQKEFINE